MGIGNGPPVVSVLVLDLLSVSAEVVCSAEAIALFVERDQPVYSGVSISTHVINGDE
jgi:hypothetical protein